MFLQKSYKATETHKRRCLTLYTKVNNSLFVPRRIETKKILLALYKVYLCFSDIFYRITDRFFNSQTEKKSRPRVKTSLMITFFLFFWSDVIGSILDIKSIFVLQIFSTKLPTYFLIARPKKMSKTASEDFFNDYIFNFLIWCHLI